MKGAKSKAIVALFIIVCCFSQGLANYPYDYKGASTKPESDHELSCFHHPWIPHLPRIMEQLIIKFLITF